MKKKAMIMAVASLGSMALIGTGFAGWVISANAEMKAEGVITAFDVADQRLVVTDGTWKNGDADAADAKAAKGKIVFGKKDVTLGAEVTPWFTFNEAGGAEQLTDIYTFTVASRDKNDTAGKFTASFKTGGFAVTSAPDAWTAATTAELVGDPKISFDKTEYNLNGTTGVAVTMTVTFKWGSHFGDLNPYEFYNKKDGGAAADGEKPADYELPAGATYTWVDDAKYSLTKLVALKDAAFKITASIDAKPNY